MARKVTSFFRTGRTKGVGITRRLKRKNPHKGSQLGYAKAGRKGGSYRKR